MSTMMPGSGATADAVSGEAQSLVVVVGYDGTPPARRALGRAEALVRERGGQLEVVYVAHVPNVVRLGTDGLSEVRQGLDEQTQALAGEVGDRLAGSGLQWHFERRDGDVDVELLAAAGELRDRHGNGAEVVIVVGGPEQWFHHAGGSVASGIVRRDQFPLVVVP